MSDQRSFHMHHGASGTAITVRVIPRARHNQLVELMNDGSLKIRLVDGDDDQKSNQILLDFLCEILGVDKSQLEIVAGLTGRQKLITITGMDSQTLQEMIVKRIG